EKRLDQSLQNLIAQSPPDERRDALFTASVARLDEGFTQQSQLGRVRDQLCLDQRGRTHRNGVNLPAGVDVRRRARIPRDQFRGQIQLFNQDQEFMRAAQAVRPAFDQKTFGVATANDAAHAVADFQQQRVTAHLFQPMSRDQAGNARADDYRINIHLVCFGAPPDYARGTVPASANAPFRNRLSHGNPHWSLQVFADQVGESADKGRIAVQRGHAAVGFDAYLVGQIFVEDVEFVERLYVIGDEADRNRQ